MQGFNIAPKSIDEAVSLIKNVQGATFLDEKAKATLLKKIQQNLDAQMDVAASNRWIKYPTERMAQLKAQIRADHKSNPAHWPPAKVGADRVIAIAMDMLDCVNDASGKIEATPKELSERTGIHINTIRNVRNYLIKIGFIVTTSDSKSDGLYIM